MSYCREEGKDKIMFMTKEEMGTPVKALIQNLDDDETEGALLPSGEINWACPCLGGNLAGPCGAEFREVLTSDMLLKKDDSEENKNSVIERMDAFRACTRRHADYYDKMAGGLSHDDDDDMEELNEELSALNTDGSEKTKEETESKSTKS